MDVHAGFLLAVISQKEDAVLNGVGEVVDCDAELGHRAEHALGQDAAHFALCDLLAAGDDRFMESHRDKDTGGHVRGAGDNGDGLLFSDVDRADKEPVGVRMFFHGENFTDNDIFEGLALMAEGLDFGAGNGQRLGEVSVRDVDVHVVLQPSL